MEEKKVKIIAMYASSENTSITKDIAELDNIEEAKAYVEEHLAHIANYAYTLTATTITEGGYSYNVTRCLPFCLSYVDIIDYTAPHDEEEETEETLATPEEI